MSQFIENASRQITRRHCLSHLALAGVSAGAYSQFAQRLYAQADALKQKRQSCILIWMPGGVPTIDLWDLKPQSKNGGEFKPIATSAPGVEISEMLPKTAQQMKHLSIIRSMSTREADHGRGIYYLHSGFIPNPTVVHPTFGSVVSHELREKRTNLSVPAFVSVNNRYGSAGYLGMTHAALQVNSFGQIRQLDMPPEDRAKMTDRLELLKQVETRFIKSGRGEMPQAHNDVSQQALALFTSKQLDAFKIDKEPTETQDRYGRTEPGRSLLLARRLVEIGVPFVEVSCTGPVLGGLWDLHFSVFSILRTALPPLDQAFAALVEDLNQRKLLEKTTVLIMSEFGRSPTISAAVGREHWANGWSMVIGGGGLKGGRAIGATDRDGMTVVGNSYLPGDVWATVATALGIPLDIVHTSKNGRPMKLAGGGTPIRELME